MILSRLTFFVLASTLISPPSYGNACWRAAKAYVNASRMTAEKAEMTILKPTKTFKDLLFDENGKRRTDKEIYALDYESRPHSKPYSSMNSGELIKYLMDNHEADIQWTAKTRYDVQQGWLLAFITHPSVKTVGRVYLNLPLPQRIRAFQDLLKTAIKMGAVQGKFNTDGRSKRSDNTVFYFKNYKDMVAFAKHAVEYCKEKGYENPAPPFTFQLGDPNTPVGMGSSEVEGSWRQYVSRLLANADVTEPDSPSFIRNLLLSVVAGNVDPRYWLPIHRLTEISEHSR